MDLGLLPAGTIPCIPSEPFILSFGAREPALGVSLRKGECGFEPCRAAIFAAVSEQTAPSSERGRSRREKGSEKDRANGIVPAQFQWAKFGVNAASECGRGVPCAFLSRG